MKIKIFIFILPVLLAGCNQKITDDKDYFLIYDRSELNDKEKEKLLDSLYIHFTAQDNDSATRYSLLRVASRYEKLDLNTKYYTTVNKVHHWALAKKDTLDIAKSLWYKGDFYDNKEVFDSAFHIIPSQKNYTVCLKKTV